jgi:type IV fimbrial biogenesis protein FimT
VLGTQEGRLVLNRALNGGRDRGFTLIELMIAISLLAILMFLGVPSFSTYIQNAKLRGAAENFYAGMQQARAEAVRRNAQVQIILTNDNPVIGNTNSAALSNTGANWMIRRLDPTTGQYAFIEGKFGTEGSGNTGNAAQITGTVSSVTYNGFGTTVGGGGSFAITNPNGGTCAPAGKMRCLNVVVSNGGQARLCDPAVDPVANPGDTRAC